MTSYAVDRRELLALGLSLVAAPALAREPAAETVIRTADGRDLTIVITRPNRPRGVMLFSHGLQGRPQNYERFLRVCTDTGFAVFAPVHVDSLENRRRADWNFRRGFEARIADLRAVSAYSQAIMPGLPMVAGGHSYGSLMAMILAGALDRVVGARDGGVRAALGFSSPGAIPTAVVDDAYAGLTRPLMLVTGDQDVLPGLVSDWRDHLLGYDSSPPGSKYAIVVRGGNHDFIKTADLSARQFEEVASLTRLFLLRYALDDVRAGRDLDRWSSTSNITLLRR